MNSFSSIVTVSNFKTAGRAVLVLALFMMSVFASSYSFAAEPTKKPAPVKKPAAATAAAPAAAPASTTSTQVLYGGATTPDPAALPRYNEEKAKAACAADKTSSDCKYWTEAWKNSANPGGDRKCDQASSSFTDTFTKLSEACSAIGTSDIKECYQRTGYCTRQDSKLADETYDDEDAPEEDSEECNKMLANRCPQLDRYMDGRDYRKEEKDAERERKETKRDVDDLLEDQQKLQSEQIQLKQELQEQIQNAGRSRIRKSQEIIDRAKSDKENLSESTRKAMDDARSVYNQMDAKYIELRARARAASSKVGEAEDKLQETCRAAASFNYSKAEAARLAAQKLGKRNVGSATAMAGGSKRKAAKDTRTRNADYVKFFTDCTGGISTEGRSAINAINKALRDQKNEEQLIADQSALIEKQRLDVLQKLKDMEASVPQKEQKIIEAMNQELKNLDEDYNLAVQQANQKASSAQQEASSKMMIIQNKLAEAQREMGDHAKESMLAKRRQMCLGRAGKGDDSKREKRNSAGNSVAGYGRNLFRLCTQISSCPDTYHPTGSIDVCDSYNYDVEHKKDPAKWKTKR